MTLLGLGLIAAAALRRKSDNDFIVQASLAASLVGQAMFAWGLADSAGGNDETDVRDDHRDQRRAVLRLSGRIHRVLSVLFAVCALVVLIYDAELNAVVPVLGPALAGALVAVKVRRGRLIARVFGKRWR